MNPAATALSPGEQTALQRLRDETPLYALNCLKIVSKQAKLIPFDPNEGQLELDRQLEAQSAEGKPMRGLVLKARQVGMSTWVQGKLLQRTTLRENQNAVVVAHDSKTGDKLFGMGTTMYGNLPDDPILKPEIRSRRRGRFLHFAPAGQDAWQRGDNWPNSTYFVDTAGEFESGRGGTYQLAHLSEFAFWERPLDKLTALMAAIPQEEGTMIVVESTANGMNLFRDLWVDAEEGRSAWFPFFWAWHQDSTYTLPFANDHERERFESELGSGAYGEDEPRLLELGLSYEQLYWRRQTIATTCAGRVEKFHQEFPSTPEEAFLTSGQAVFDQHLVKGVLVGCDLTDPRHPSKDAPGPRHGMWNATDADLVYGRGGDMIERPTKSIWTPRQGIMNATDWKLWIDPASVKPEDQFVIGVDVSGGEMDEGYTTQAWHSIEVINHKTRLQVAEYRSHIDPNALAREILLAGIFFNGAWVAVEITGGWGLPVTRRLYLDYHYPSLYVHPSHGRTAELVSKEPGWSTTKGSKNLMEANLSQMLREGDHGIQSRTLANEMLTYVRDEKGRTAPEPGKFSDCLIAYMIAQQVANEMPIRIPRRTKPRGYVPHNAVTGY